MSLATYPADLPGITQASKARAIPAKFATMGGFGEAGAQQVAADVPVAWDISLAFNDVQAAQFWAWYRNSINSGRDMFAMPIRTEFGIVTHPVMIDPETPIRTQQQGGLTTYSMRIIARRLIVPADRMQDAASIIALVGYRNELGYPWQEYAALLDQTVNEAYPHG